MSSFQIRVGKISLAANLESDGVITSTMFFDNSTTTAGWEELLMDSCPANETIAADAMWKVRTFRFTVMNEVRLK
jgi:hypothetical protein